MCCFYSNFLFDYIKIFFILLFIYLLFKLFIEMLSLSLVCIPLLVLLFLSLLITIITAAAVVVALRYIFKVRVKHIHKWNKPITVLKWSKQNCRFLVCCRVQWKYPVQWHTKITIYFSNSLICCIFSSYITQCRCDIKFSFNGLIHVT